MTAYKCKEQLLWIFQTQHHWSQQCFKFVHFIRSLACWRCVCMRSSASVLVWLRPVLPSLVPLRLEQFCWFLDKKAFRSHRFCVRWEQFTCVRIIASDSVAKLSQVCAQSMCIVSTSNKISLVYLGPTGPLVRNVSLLSVQITAAGTETRDVAFDNVNGLANIRRRWRYNIEIRRFEQVILARVHGKRCNTTWFGR